MTYLLTGKGREVACQLDKLPTLTEWVNDKAKSSSSVKEVYDDLKVFIDAASSDKTPIEERRALLDVVKMVEELSTGKGVLYYNETSSISGST